MTSHEHGKTTETAQKTGMGEIRNCIHCTEQIAAANMDEHLKTQHPEKMKLEPGAGGHQV